MPLPRLLLASSRRRRPVQAPTSPVDDTFSLASQVRAGRRRVAARLRALGALRLLIWRQDLLRFVELAERIDNLPLTDPRLQLTVNTDRTFRFPPLGPADHERIRSHAGSIVPMNLGLGLIEGSGSDMEMAELAAGLVLPAGLPRRVHPRPVLNWLMLESTPSEPLSVLGGIQLSVESLHAISDPHRHRGVRSELLATRVALTSLEVLLATCIDELESLRVCTAHAQKELDILLCQNRDYRQISASPMPGVRLGGRPLIWLNHHYARALALIVERPLLDDSARPLPQAPRLLDVCRAARALHRPTLH